MALLIPPFFRFPTVTTYDSCISLIFGFGSNIDPL